MQIHLHIGLAEVGAPRLQSVLRDKRSILFRHGVLVPRSLGRNNHTRLFMAITDPEHVDPLRFNRGYATPQNQAALYASVAADLARELAQHTPDHLVLSAWQLGVSLTQKSELERLRAVLSPLSTDIRIIAHVDAQAPLLARHYAAQVAEGRGRSLNQECALAGKQDWWAESLATQPPIDPLAGQFAETQGAPFWLDYTRLVAHWEGVFGNGSMQLRPHDADVFYGAKAASEITAMLGLDIDLGDVDAAPAPPPVPAATVARMRQMNALLLRLLAQRAHILPRPLWRSFLSELAVPGLPIHAGSLAHVAAHFAENNAKLVKAHPALRDDFFKALPAQPAWTEADPAYGFRASQYLLGFMWRLEKATRQARRKRGVIPAPDEDHPQSQTPKTRVPAPLSPAARALLPAQAIENFHKLQGSPFAPHNQLGQIDEAQRAPDYTAAAPRDLPEGQTGNVIVGCMKNEAPYILEWIAYHRTIGVDHFLIYTNDCTDGTAEILDRLQDLRIVQHRKNDNWKGNSPQQYALNQAQKEPLIQKASWIIHIDVDEFMNIRTGNGTLDDFLACVPDATNVAMTWRLFGHNGVTHLSDDFVIAQFDHCAPKFCPKPHTVWGFKTMFRNIGAYEKISCHRPNKLNEAQRRQVKWVNGSGADMTREAAEKGWRSSKNSIGYDLIQLNHYALRSAESYLIKRQRGRALHVDRSIGINYWIRMDWSDHRDITIQRNIPRVRAEYKRLMQDVALRDLHNSGLAWHRAKAQELHETPEFEALYTKALQIKLTPSERVAYALALDMES